MADCVPKVAAKPGNGSTARHRTPTCDLVLVLILNGAPAGPHIHSTPVGKKIALKAYGEHTSCERMDALADQL